LSSQPRALELDRRQLDPRAIRGRSAAPHRLEIAALRLVVLARRAGEVAERRRRVTGERALRVAGEERLVGRAPLRRILGPRCLRGGVGLAFLARRLGREQSGAADDRA
jgi:hypothetical protein